MKNSQKLKKEDNNKKTKKNASQETKIVRKTTSKNNKGFTLIEIIGVVIILGIIAVIGTMGVRSYIEDSKAKTYESYKQDLKGASENLLIDCMTNNEEGCVIPDYDNDLRITYNELVKKGYSERLKDPEGDGYCDRSYVIAKNKSENGVDIEYKVCLYCDKYKSDEEGCEELRIDDTTPPTCGETKGGSTTWSKDNKVISVGCSDTGSGCRRNPYSKNIGKQGGVIRDTTITIEDNAGNKTSCPVNAYVDKKAPTCKIEVEESSSSDGWYKNNTVATITAISDEGSSEDDPDSIEFGMGTSLANRDYNSKTSYTVNGGIVTVFGYVKDKVGNEGYCSKEIKVDNTNPTAGIYMGYEVYPKENTTISGSTMTINNLDKYGEINGLIVYFSSNMSTTMNVINASGASLLTGTSTYVSGNRTIVKLADIQELDSIKLQMTSNANIKKITKVEVIKKQNNTTVWTNKDISVYVEGKDTITGIGEYSFDNGATYSNNIIMTYSSNTTGIIRVKDRAGNISFQYPFTIDTIDKEDPSLDITNPTNGNWTNESFALTLDSTDEDSGVNSFYYSYSSSASTVGTDANTQWKTYITYTSYQTDVTYDTTNFVNEREQSAYIRVCDNAGNCTSDDTPIKIDKTKPSCTLVSSGTKGNDDWYISNVSVSFSQYKDEGDVQSDIASYGIGSVTSSKTRTLSTNTSGTTYTGYIKDNAGNTNTCTVTVKRDATAPTLKVIANRCSDAECNSATDTKVSETSTNGATLTIDWTNKAGGLFEYTVTETNFDYVVWNWNASGNNTYQKALEDADHTSEKTATTGTTTLTAPGYRVGKLTAYDKAGNSTVVNVEVKIDKTAPTLKVIANRCSDTTCESSTVTKVSETSTKGATLTIDWTNKAGQFNYSVAEDNFDYVVWNWNVSGNDTYQQAIEDENHTSKKTSKEGETTLTSAGYRVGKLTAYDKAGNSTVVNVEVKIDRTPPSMSFTNPKDGVWTNQNIEFTINASDSGSDIEGYYYSYSGQENDYERDPKGPDMVFSVARENTAYLRVCDNAGNCNTKTTSIKIDKTPPSISYGTKSLTQYDEDENIVSSSILSGQSNWSFLGQEYTTKARLCLSAHNGKMEFDSGAGFSDDRSGLAISDVKSTMYDKNGYEIEGCLRTAGNNPCLWMDEYTLIDRAGNITTATDYYSIGYIGYDSFCG